MDQVHIYVVQLKWDVDDTSGKRKSSSIRVLFTMLLLTSFFVRHSTFKSTPAEAHNSRGVTWLH